MCENDHAVDAWFNYIAKISFGPNGDIPDMEARGRRAGLYSGTIRELAATVPGVREWLIEHMPEEK